MKDYQLNITAKSDLNLAMVKWKEPFNSEGLEGSLVVLNHIADVLLEKYKELCQWKVK